MSSSKFVDDDRFDGLYLNVAQTAHGIEPLLDTVFSFLRRKTDFFAGPPGSTNGTDDAIRKVNQVLQKHADIYQKEQEKKNKNKTTTTKQDTNIPKKAKQSKELHDVIEMGKDGGFDVASSLSPSSSQAEAEAEAESPSVATSASVIAPPAGADAAEKQEQADAAAAAASAASATAAEAKTETKEPDTEEDAPPVGNGGTVDGKYVWTQVLSELAVTVPLPDNTRGRDLNVTIAKKHLKVGLKQPQNGKITTKWLVDAPLTKPVIIDDSFWTVEDGNRLVINLQKANQMEWWDSVCVGDPKINIQKIQPENSSLADLDGETRKTVEKMMFDQRQKAMGLPTSDEQQKFEMLEKFKQQHPELDFSNAKIS